MSLSITSSLGASAGLPDDPATALLAVQGRSDASGLGAAGRSLREAHQRHDEAVVHQREAEQAARDAAEDAGGWGSFLSTATEVAVVAGAVAAAVAVPGGGLVAAAALTSAGLGVGAAVAQRMGAGGGVVTGLAVASAATGIASGVGAAASGATVASTTLRGVAAGASAVQGGASAAGGYARIEQGRAQASVVAAEAVGLRAQDAGSLERSRERGAGDDAEARASDQRYAASAAAHIASTEALTGQAILAQLRG